MTVAELKRGQQELCRRLYAPTAFAERLLANLYRFRDMRYRPEAVTRASLRTLFLLAKTYGRQGWAANRFFWSTLVKAFWHSPRSLSQTINMLGMYQHFCKVLSQDASWNPWAPEVPEPRHYSSRISVSDGLSRIGHDEVATCHDAERGPRDGGTATPDDAGVARQVRRTLWREHPGGQPAVADTADPLAAAGAGRGGPV